MRPVRLVGRVAAAGVVAAEGHGCIVCGLLRAARRLQPHVLRLEPCGPREQGSARACVRVFADGERSLLARCEIPLYSEPKS